MKKNISFGKIAYSSKSKINSVTIEIELKQRDTAIAWDTFEQLSNVPELSICGSIWDAKHYDCECCGQCLDTIKEYLPDNAEFSRICDIWEQYHLNDMNSGSKAQTDFLNALKATGWQYSYESACKELKEAGLYFDKGYKYGSAWLYRPIPDNVLTEIKELINS